eukprot:3384124-Prymnesium_polylepis.1
MELRWRSTLTCCAVPGHTWRRLQPNRLRLRPCRCAGRRRTRVSGRGRSRPRGGATLTSSGQAAGNGHDREEVRGADIVSCAASSTCLERMLNYLADGRCCRQRRYRATTRAP